MKAVSPIQTFFFCRSGPFGPYTIIWSVHGDRPGVHRVILSRPEAAARHVIKSAFRCAVHSSCAEIDEVADQIGASLGGHDIRFYLDIVRLDLCSQFQRKVLHAEHGIPRGSISTYKRIATHLGTPYGARAVGGALSGNPFPVIIPCHRAIRSDRTLGGYQGGLKMKRALLEMEGIAFDRMGRVVKGNYLY